jgi:hypothetical protein
MYYKTVDNKILFDGPGECIYYIPEKYFDLNVASINGNYVSAMGLFPYAIYNKSGKLEKYSLIHLCNVFTCKPYKIEKDTLELKNTKGPAAYRLLYFKDKDELISDTNIPHDVDNVDKFMNLYIRGNLFSGIPNNKILDYILDNASRNNFKYKCSPQILGVLIGVLSRNKNNLEEPFRFAATNNNQYDYITMPITKVPKYTSPYTAITSENADEAVAAALTIKSNADSPLEKIVMETPTADDIYFMNGEAYITEDMDDLDEDEY